MALSVPGLIAIKPGTFPIPVLYVAAVSVNLLSTTTIGIPASFALVKKNVKCGCVVLVSVDHMIINLEFKTSIAGLP